MTMTNDDDNVNYDNAATEQLITMMCLAVLLTAVFCAFIWAN